MSRPSASTASPDLLAHRESMMAYEAYRRLNHHANLATRAWRIVERVKPRLTCVPSGWAEPRLFIDASLYNDQRNRLFKRIFHRLLEKEPFNG